jgi:hypothetical protein
MPDREAAAKILPKSGKDRRTLWSISGFLGLIVVFVVAVLFFQHRRQQEIEGTWQSAIATIEDVRPVVVSQVNSQFGGAMLYQVEVLAHYNANGSEQRRWIRIERKPGLVLTRAKQLVGKANSSSFDGKLRNRIK